MQTFARVLALLGVIVIVIAAVLLGYDVIQINQLHAVAISNRSAGFNNPVYSVLWTALLALVGGFVAGLGVAMLRQRPAANVNRPS